MSPSRCAIGGCCYQSIQSIAACSNWARVRHGPWSATSSALKVPLSASAIALSYLSPSQVMQVNVRLIERLVQQCFGAHYPISFRRGEGPCVGLSLIDGLG
jgi:hypothetical protein